MSTGQRAPDGAPEEPFDRDSERAVLGDLLLNGTGDDPVLGQLSDEDFYLAEHRLIFAAIQTLHQACRPRVDAAAVIEQLRTTRQLQKAGGPDAVAAIAAPSPTPLTETLRTVEGMRKLRTLLDATAEIKASIEQGGPDAPPLRRLTWQLRRRRRPRRR